MGFYLDTGHSVYRKLEWSLSSSAACRLGLLSLQGWRHQMPFEFHYVAWFHISPPGFSLKAAVYLKIEMIPPLGSGLINYNNASCYVGNSFLSFILG